MDLQPTINLFKEAWVGHNILYAMTEITVVLERGSSENFTQNSRKIEEKEGKGIYNNKSWKCVQQFRKQDTSNSQTGKYFIKCLLSRYVEFEAFLSLLLELTVNFLLKRLQSKLLRAERIPLQELSTIFQKNVAPNPGLFEKVYQTLSEDNKNLPFAVWFAKDDGLIPIPSQ